MASETHLAIRRQRAAQELQRVCALISGQIGIEPPESVPGSIHDKAHREVTHLECLAEFISRAHAAIGPLTEAATSKPRKKVKDEQSDRVDQAAPAG